MLDDQNDSSSFDDHNTQENIILSVNNEKYEAHDGSKEQFVVTVLIRVQLKRIIG